jgi:hypothetical protein
LFQVITSQKARKSIKKLPERANSNNFNAKDRPNALKIQEEVISFFISFEERSIDVIG